MKQVALDLRLIIWNCFEFKICFDSSETKQKKNLNLQKERVGGKTRLKKKRMLANKRKRG